MNDFSKGAAWINGEIVPLADAKISVTDWGFTRSDATYDVVGVWDGAFFRLEDHLDRFMMSLKKMHLAPDVTKDDIRRILHAIASASGLRHAYCAFVSTRGMQKVPGSRDPRTCDNRFFAWIVPWVNVLAEDVLARGAAMKIAEGPVRIDPRSVDPTAKNYHWGDLTAGLFEALEEGFDTVVLKDHDGNITEGPGFNVFAVIGGRVVTSDRGVLEGITRKTVLEIAAKLGLGPDIRALPAAEFLDADEVFLATTGGGVMPIVRVNDRIFGNGAPGPVTQRLRDTYNDWRANGPLRTPITYAAHG
jgi:branched-chain amino acid aminotransferase